MKKNWIHKAYRYEKALEEIVNTGLPKERAGANRWRSIAQAALDAKKKLKEN